MPKFNTSTPSGFPEFSPAQESVRQSWMNIIRNTYHKYGYLTIETPLVEREENLLGKGGNPKEIYVLKRLHDSDNDTSHSGNALRFDQTVPLALYVARHQNDIAFPFKRQVIGPVFRGERAQKGRFRQFYQCDIDVIGMENLPLMYDAEMVSIINEIFSQFDIGKFIVKINNRKTLTGFFAGLGIPEDKIKPVLDIVDDLEKMPTDVIQKHFKDQGIAEHKIKKILTFTAIKGTPNEVLKQVATMSDHEIFQTGMSELRQVIQGIEGFGVPEANYQVDLSIARGLDYYTGTVYETKLVDNPHFGSVVGGGRYADLAKVFTGKSMPGVGISIGLTRLLSQCFEAGLVMAEKSSPSQILIVTTDPGYEPRAITIGQQLRTSGLVVENYFGDRKLAKKFRYGEKAGIPYVAVIGESEMANNTVTLKNMETGEQNEMNVEEISHKLRL